MSISNLIASFRALFITPPPPDDDILPPELRLKVFSFLELKDREHCLRVCTLWQRIASDSTFWPFPEIAFGKDKWKTYWNHDVGDEPPIPFAFHTILKEKSRRFPEKRVEEVCRLCLAPQNVNLKKLVELVQATTKRGKPIECRFKKTELFENISPKRSYWFLISKYLLEGTRGKSREQQLAIIAEVPGEKIPIPLEVAIGVLSEFEESGERLLNEDPWSYTRTEEEGVTVGGFVSTPALHINDVTSVDDESEGVLSVIRNSA